MSFPGCEPFLSLGNSWYGAKQLSLTCAGSPGSSLGRCPPARVSPEFLLHHLCGKLRTAWHSAGSGAVEKGGEGEERKCIIGGGEREGGGGRRRDYGRRRANREGRIMKTRR